MCERRVARRRGARARRSVPDNIQKANGKLQGLSRDFKSNRELHSSYHSTFGRASTSPKTIGLLYKSSVLVHAMQYLRYIHSHTQLQKIQTELNKSMQSVFGCAGVYEIKHLATLDAKQVLRRVRLLCRRVADVLRGHVAEKQGKNDKHPHEHVCLNVSPCAPIQRYR